MFSFATSVGILTLLLAAIVLLGIRSGGAAWFGGIATILLLIVYVAIAGESGPGGAYGWRCSAGCSRSPRGCSPAADAGRAA